MKLRVNIDIKLNRIVKFFVLSDLFLLSGWGLIDPIFSVFIIQRIVGATLVTIGIAAAIYWILRAILQVPIAKFIDRTPGERDDFYVLMIGLVIAGFSSLSFALVHTATELYVVQAIRALAFACYGAAWPSIFSRHLDKDKVSLDWTADGVAAGIGSGVAGLLGGLVGQYLGYNAVFIMGAVLSLFAAFVLIGVPELIVPRTTTSETEIKDHRPGSIGV